jgi:hypothetical protein
MASGQNERPCSDEFHPGQTSSDKSQPISCKTMSREDPYPARARIQPSQAAAAPWGSRWPRGATFVGVLNVGHLKKAVTDLSHKSEPNSCYPR